MYPAPTSTPTPDATPVLIGRRIALTWVAIGSSFVAVDLVGMFIAFKAILDPAALSDPFVSLVAGWILILVFGPLGGLCLRTALKRRKIAISTDYSGLWLTDGTARAVVPWNDVAAVGLHEFVQNAQWFSYSSWSIELRLHEPIDRDDPLIDRMVLPADPPRYMIHLPRGTHIDAMAAIRARVPELWLEAPESS